MASFWNYCSFSPKSWTALFDGSLPQAKKYFVAAGWEPLGDYPDPGEQPKAYYEFLWKNAPKDIARMAEHLARNGPTYQGLDAHQASVLDSIFCGFFSPEGLEPLLEFTYEHYDGLSPSAIDELLSRARDVKVGGLLGFGGRISKGRTVRLAPALATGRRCGSDVPPTLENMYFVFDYAEVTTLLTEVEGLLAVNRPWKTPEFEKAIRKELLAALHSAAGTGRYLAGRF